MMKHGSVWLIALILLTGCDVQPKSPPTARPPIHEPEGINDAPVAEQPAAEIPAEFTAKVIKVTDGDTL